MTQLEKLTTLTFHLTYHAPSQDEFFSSNNARDWMMMTLSRKTSKTFTPMPINDTFRSTLSRKFNAIFTKTNSTRSVVHPPAMAMTKEQEASLMTYQSRTSRASLNVDKPRSVRYRAKSLSAR